MRRSFHALAAAVVLAGLGTAAYAGNYHFKLPLKGIAPPADWQAYEPLHSDWEDVGDVFGCSNWAPDPATVTVGQAFTQTATDCQQDQMRTVQPRERDTHSGSIRNVGEPFTETRTLTASATRDAVGTRETWSAAEAIYSVWKNSGEPYGCTNWSPDPATVTVGQAFTQTATDCKQDQTRTRQDREYEPTLGEHRNVGEPIIETQTVTTSSTRSATGTKETWVAYDPLYGSWTNSGGVHSCTAWSPDPSTVTSGQTFTQNRTCKQDQTRTVQPRERETTLGTIRNAGAATTETRTLSVNQSQQATGTKASYIYSPPQTYAYCVAGVVQGGRQGTGNTIRYNGVNVFHAWVPTVGACIFAPGKEFEGNDGHTYVIGAKSGAEFSVLRR